MDEPENHKKNWLDRPRSVDKIIRAVAVICLAVLAADFFYEKHGHYSWEEWPGFYALFGFLSFVVIDVGGKVLRKLVMRDEDYYD